MVAAVGGRFGKLDILVNNAAPDSDIAADAMATWHGLNEAGRLMGGVQGDCVMDLKLRGKAALVTGSSRGIGLATAKAFAAEGCRVMLSARSTGQLRETETALRATGAEVAAHAADVGSPDGAAGLIEATVAAYGGIDILVNAPGRPFICGNASRIMRTVWMRTAPMPQALSTAVEGAPRSGWRRLVDRRCGTMSNAGHKGNIVAPVFIFKV